MSCACTPILVGVASPVSEILLLSKMAKFPFPTMDYSPWLSKYSINWNWLKIFMQVGIDVECMYTNFGGRGLSGFGDKISLWSIKVEKFNQSESARRINATRGRCHVHLHQFWWAWSLRFQGYGYLSKTAKFPFWGMDYSPWSSKNSIDWNRLKKFMQVGIDVKFIYTNFGGRDLSSFGDMANFKNGQISLLGHGRPWSSKNSINRNRLKKFMQVKIDVKFMHTDFGGCGLFGFGDKISLWSIKVEKFNRSESAQKIHATRGRCHVHAHQFWWA